MDDFSGFADEDFSALHGFVVSESFKSPEEREDF